MIITRHDEVDKIKSIIKNFVDPKIQGSVIGFTDARFIISVNSEELMLLTLIFGELDYLEVHE